MSVVTPHASISLPITLRLSTPHWVLLSPPPRWSLTAETANARSSWSRALYGRLPTTGAVGPPAGLCLNVLMGGSASGCSYWVGFRCLCTTVAEHGL